MGAKTATAAPRPDLPFWRSLLYVPAHIPRFIDKAHIRGANAIILDLEDSVPAAGRDRARALVAESADKVSQGGADVLVRINRPDAEAEADLEAVLVDETPGGADNLGDAELPECVAEPAVLAFNLDPLVCPVDDPLCLVEQAAFITVIGSHSISSSFRYCHRLLRRLVTVTGPVPQVVLMKLVTTPGDLGTPPQVNLQSVHGSYPLYSMLGPVQGDSQELDKISVLFNY